MKPIQTLLLILVLFGIALPQGGCACWQPAHAQDKQCVVLHQVIDCTETAAATLGPILAGILSAFVLQGNVSVDWTAIEQYLEAAGIRDGGCLLAQLENDIIGKAQGSPEKMERAKVVGNVFRTWKEKMGVSDVKFRVIGLDGKPVLR